MASDAVMHRYPNGRNDEFEDYVPTTDSANQLHKNKSKRPRYFPSNKPQSFIKNAVTGLPYPYTVGSEEQSLLYKLVDTTGTCDADGYVIKSRSELPNPNTNHLFFDSPEQCMSHMRLNLNPAEVKRWHDSRTPTSLVN
jgi:hypothetical protein